jgi:hypothetical protein
VLLTSIMQLLKSLDRFGSSRCSPLENALAGVATSLPLDRWSPRYPRSKKYLLEMASYGNEPERLANGANQSANKGC